MNMNTIRVVIMMPGSIGVELDEMNVVVDVDAKGQFEQNGVQVGWKLVEIDGMTYSDDLLRSRIAGADEYVLAFSVEEHVCVECGNTLDADSLFCCFCGAKVFDLASAVDAKRALLPGVKDSCHQAEALSCCSTAASLSEVAVA
jgi:hypothetical protein